MTPVQITIPECSLIGYSFKLFKISILKATEVKTTFFDTDAIIWIKDNTTNMNCTIT